MIKGFSCCYAGIAKMEQTKVIPTRGVNLIDKRSPPFFNLPSSLRRMFESEQAQDGVVRQHEQKKAVKVANASAVPP